MPISDNTLMLDENDIFHFDSDDKIDFSNKQLKRYNHARIDDYFQHPDSQLKFRDTPAAIMIRDIASLSPNPPPCSTILTHADSPFELEDVFTYTVKLPLIGPLGLLLEKTLTLVSR